MFNYYRFIKSNINDCLAQLEQQAKTDKLLLNIKSHLDAYEDNYPNRVNVVVKSEVIIDIYKG